VLTVRMLAEEEEEGWMVEVEVQLQPDTAEGSAPDLWHVAWTHFAEVIRDNFWEYIDEHCPEPDAVREAVRNLEPPEELKDLFAEPEPVPLPKARLVPLKKVQKKPEEKREEPAMLEKDRWYFVEVYPRSLEEPQYRFVGKLIAEDRKEDEHLLEDQDGYLYYLRFAHFDVKDDSVSVRSEWAERGRSIADICEVFDEICQRTGGPGCPLLQELVRVE